MQCIGVSQIPVSVDLKVRFAKESTKIQEETVVIHS